YYPFNFRAPWSSSDLELPLRGLIPKRYFEGFTSALRISRMSENLELSLSPNGSVTFVIVLLEQAGVPIPAAPLLLAAGALCSTGEASPAMILGATVVACLIADLTWFYIGRRGGKRIIHSLSRVALLHHKVGQMERAFSRHATPVVVIAKFVPGLS